MLTDAFQTALDNAEPGKRVTAVVFWDVRPTDAGSAALARAASIKAPIIDAARACPGARVNPLEGTYQAILDVPVEGWRRILRSERARFDAADLRVEANVPAFATFPEP